MPKKTAVSCFFIALSLVLFPGISADAGQDQGAFDILIKNARVFDGTGSEAERADVAIQGDKPAGSSMPKACISAPVSSTSTPTRNEGCSIRRTGRPSTTSSRA